MSATISSMSWTELGWTSKSPVPGRSSKPSRRRELKEVDLPPVALRDVVEEDLDVFFEQQRDPDANAMAAFPARDRQEHFAHWRRILDDDTVITKSILYGDDVVGNIVSWIQDGKREIGYWIGRAHWGKGVATSALRSFLEVDVERPVFAWVARHNAGSIRVLRRLVSSTPARTGST
jgi:RimJ/RimL family protein N-acetyltransferase